MKTKYKNILFFILAAMLLFACTQANPADLDSSSTYKPVDALFREFYKRQGGEERLGKAISVLQVNAGLKTQYLETSVMVFDSLAEVDQRFYFKSIGTDLGYYEEAPGRNYPQATDSVIDGYVIYPAFISIYKEFGGERFTGKLISSWNIDESNGSIEQHFENVGFYISLEDSERNPKLLPYGLLACGKNCLAENGANSGIIGKNILREPFAADALNYGDELLGSHLLGAYQNPAGYEEVIFENAVLMATVGSNRSKPRPIAQELGYGSPILVAPLNNPNTTFVLLKNGLGHNIPNFFIKFIQQTGSADFYGLPITEFEAISDSVFRQCFTNMCLEFHADIQDKSKQIKPSPLGYQYQLEIFSTFGIESVTSTINENQLINPPVPEEPTLLPENLSPSNTPGQLIIWDKKSLISSTESQIIYVSVYSGTKALSQIELVVSYYSDTIPTQEINFPPTNQNGYAEIALPPIVAANGEIIEYQVCLRDASLAIICETENFVIWGN